MRIGGLGPDNPNTRFTGKSLKYNNLNIFKIYVQSFCQIFNEMYTLRKITATIEGKLSETTCK